MCNCGSRRAALASQPAAERRGDAQEVDRRSTTSRGAPGGGDVSLVSRSLNSFVLRGHVSGRQYHFLPGATVRVEAGDARGLLASGRVRRGS